MHRQGAIERSGLVRRGHCGVFAAVLAATLLAPVTQVCAQAAPDSENGRFTLSPVPEGFLRMDTRTGSVSLCTSKGGWTCRLVPDERAAFDTEIGRLQADNKALKEQLARRDAETAKTDTGKVQAPPAGSDSQKSAQAAPDRKPELQLPPEHEKLLALIDRVWTRLIEMANQFQKRLSEKI